MTTTLQQGLNEVVINKVQKMIDGKLPGVQAAMERLEREGKIAADYIAPIGVNLKTPPEITFSGNGNVLLNMQGAQYILHDNATYQLADRLNIPAKYLRQLASGSDWQKQLAASILNEHTLHTERKKALIRTVGNEVRAVLSDSYRRLNSVKILGAFIQEAGRQGAVISDAYMSDTKVWAETILPTPFTIPTTKNGDVVVFIGARFSTSDYGNGSVDMRSFLLNGACLNGMVRESIMKQVHLGGKLPDDISLSEETYRLDTQATVSAINDLTKGLYSKDTIEKRVFEIQRASAIEVDFETELTNLISRGSILKAEGEQIQKLIMKNDPDDGVEGGSSLWKMTQAITAYARDIDPVRSRELHEISGAMLKRVESKN